MFASIYCKLLSTAIILKKVFCNFSGDSKIKRYHLRTAIKIIKYDKRSNSVQENLSKAIMNKTRECLSSVYMAGQYIQKADKCNFRPI